MALQLLPLFLVRSWLGPRQRLGHQDEHQEWPEWTEERPGTTTGLGSVSGGDGRNLRSVLRSVVLVSRPRLLQVQVRRRLRQVGVVMSSLPVLGVVRVAIMRSVVRVIRAPDPDVVVVVVVELSPLAGALTEILVVIEISPEGLVGADPGGGLGVAQPGLVRVGELPLRSVATFLLTVTVVDPVGLLAVLDSYRSTGSHHGTTRWNTNTF